MSHNLIPSRTDSSSLPGPLRRGPGSRRPNRAARRARGRRPLGARVRDPERIRVAATIEEFGLHFVHVGEGCDCPGCTAPPAPPEEMFGYTVGLTGRRHAELLVRGLGAQESAEVLNRWGGSVLAGDEFTAGDILCEGPGGRRWELVPVPRPERILLWAARHYGRGFMGGRPALELVPTERPCSCAGFDGAAS